MSTITNVIEPNFVDSELLCPLKKGDVMGTTRRNQKLKHEAVLKTDWRELFMQLTQTSEERKKAWLEVKAALVRNRRKA